MSSILSVKNNIDIIATINSAEMIVEMYDSNFERFVGLYKKLLKSSRLYPIQKIWANIKIILEKFFDRAENVTAPDQFNLIMSYLKSLPSATEGDKSQLSI